MKVSVEMFGGLKNPYGKNIFEVELKEGATVEHLLKKIGYKKHEMRFLCVFRKRTQLHLDDELQDGDKLKILIPFGGGGEN